MTPHFLAAEQKRIRVDKSCEFLHVLSVQMARQWHNIVTVDESWIDLYCEHDLMWMDPGEIVPDRGRETVQSPTLMLTIVWNPSGFHIVKALPKGGKFSAQYYRNNILLVVSDWRRLARERSPNKLWAHADNGRPDNAKVSTDFIALNRMKQSTHPP
jgi:hypothetical protein